MTDYLYYAGEALSSSNIQRTFQLLLPNGLVDDVVLGRLFGSRLWIVVREAGADCLFARFRINAVETVETELGVTEAVLNADEMESASFLSPESLDASREYVVPAGLNVNPERAITELSSSAVQAFLDIEEKARKYSLSPGKPLKFSSDDFPVIAPDSNLTSVLQAVIMAGKRNFSVADLSRWGKKPDWDEYQCLAYHFVYERKMFREEEVSIALDKLQALFLSETSRRAPKVDFNLQTIDPKKLTTRKFVSPELPSPSSMVATEKAEKAHQEILRDVSEFLIQQGVTPMESSSLDLAFQRSDGLVFFEIKSANPDNYFRQCEKALSQILRYDFELSRAEVIVADKYLILEMCIDADEQEYVSALYKHAGIGVLFYDASSPWPQRMEGFRQLIDSASPMHRQD